MSNNREAILRYIVAIHFIYTTMVLTSEWLPPAYTITQLAILVLGLWAITHREGAIEVELLMVIKCFSLLIDSVCIGMYFQLGLRTYQIIHHSFYFTISAFFAIFLLLVKPIMLILLNKVRQHRLGEAPSSTFGGWVLTGLVVGYVHQLLYTIKVLFYLLASGYVSVDEQQTA